jgi:hypothetical protein
LFFLKFHSWLRRILADFMGMPTVHRKSPPEPSPCAVSEARATAEDTSAGAAARARTAAAPRASSAPREIGGRDGPEPTRFGDWEKHGRCIDF